MNNTSRMAAMLGAMHRERNGAHADAMRFHGHAFGLNYGVSLPEVRKIARAEPPDHDFARYLYLQDVRELRLAALHLAEPERLTEAELGAWAAGIINSEVAEEAAFALFRDVRCLPELFDAWIAGDNYLLQYVAVMSAARSVNPSAEWIGPALTAVRRSAGLADALRVSEALATPTLCASTVAATQLLAQGVVALLVAIGVRSEENRQTVLKAAGALGENPAEGYIREELAWRLE